MRTEYVEMLTTVKRLRAEVIELLCDKEFMTREPAVEPVLIAMFDILEAIGDELENRPVDP